MEKKTNRVWKVSLISILSYAVGWRVTERRGASAQASVKQRSKPV